MSNGYRGEGLQPRPAVQKVEREDVGGQFLVPFMRSYAGFGLGVMSILVGATWFLWVVPPDAALQVGVFGGLVVALYVVWRGVLARYEEVYWASEGAEERARFHRWRWLYALLSAGCVLALVAMVGGMGKGWWGEGEPTWAKIAEHQLLYTFQWIFSLSLLLSGSLSAWWFWKETKTPHELTGKDRADYMLGMARLRFDWAQWEAGRRPAYQAIPDTFRVEVTERGNGQGNRVSYFEVDNVRLGKIATWAPNVLGVKEPDLTYERWSGKGNLFTRPEYDRLTEAFAKNGLLRQKRGTTGYTLTGKGRAILSAWLEQYEGGYST